MALSDNDPQRPSRNIKRVLQSGRSGLKHSGKRHYPQAFVSMPEIQAHQPAEMPSTNLGREAMLIGSRFLIERRSSVVASE